MLPEVDCGDQVWSRGLLEQRGEIGQTSLDPPKRVTVEFLVEEAVAYVVVAKRRVIVVAALLCLQLDQKVGAPQATTSTDRGYGEAFGASVVIRAFD